MRAHRPGLAYGEAETPWSFPDPSPSGSGSAWRWASGLRSRRSGPARARLESGSSTYATFGPYHVAHRGRGLVRGSACGLGASHGSDASKDQNGSNVDAGLVPDEPVLNIWPPGLAAAIGETRLRPSSDARTLNARGRTACRPCEQSVLTRCGPFRNGPHRVTTTSRKAASTRREERRRMASQTRAAVAETVQATRARPRTLLRYWPV